MLAVASSVVDEAWFAIWLRVRARFEQPQDSGSERFRSLAHSQAVELLRASGPDGMASAGVLARLVALKPRADHDPTDIGLGTARQAVEWAARCVKIASRVLAPHLRAVCGAQNLIFSPVSGHRPSKRLLTH